MIFCTSDVFSLSTVIGFSTESNIFCMLLISVQLLFYEYMHGANAVMSVSSGHLNVFAVSLIFYILCS